MMEAVVYLADKVESDHVTGLGNNRVRRKLELIVGSDCDHHGGSGSSQALGQSRNCDVREKHDDLY